jgi:hypothetical protein
VQILALRACARKEGGQKLHRHSAPLERSGAPGRVRRGQSHRVCISYRVGLHMARAEPLKDGACVLVLYQNSLPDLLRPPARGSWLTGGIRAPSSLHSVTSARRARGWQPQAAYQWMQLDVSYMLDLVSGSTMQRRPRKANS